MNISLVISIISLGLCVFGFLFFRGYIKRKTTASQLLASYRDEVHRLIAEIDDATDRDSLLVEERIKILRRLIAETDQRISVYKQEIQRSYEGQAMYANLGKGIRAVLDSRLPAQEHIEQPSVQEANPAETPEGTTNTEKKRSSKKPKTEETETTAESKKPKIKVKIAEMYAQGVPSTEIASRLGLSQAEIDLALNLLQRKMAK